MSLRKLPLIFLLLGLPALGQTAFYVSLSGSDTNAGTLYQPFRTVDKGRQAASAVACGGLTAPITVNIDATVPDATHPERPATYYQASDLNGIFELRGNGTSFPSSAGEGDNGCSTSVPIIYQGYNIGAVTVTDPKTGATSSHNVYPVISGGMRVTGWTATGATGGSGGDAWVQYSANCSAPCSRPETLYYNGERRFRQQIGTSIVNGSLTCTGTACTWVSGTTFSTQWVNSNIRIPAGGPEYKVKAVADTTHLTTYLSPAAQGAQTYNSFVLSNLGVMNAVEYFNDASKICSAGVSGDCSIVFKTDACSLGSGYGCSGGTNANCRTTNSSDPNACDDRFRYAAAGATGTADLSSFVPINLSGSTDCVGGIGSGNFDTIMTYWETFPAPLMRICGIDTTNRILIFTGELLDATTLAGGGSKSVNATYGPMDKHRFILENFVSGASKITQAQQWFLDRTVTPNKLYYNAASVLGENPATDLVEVGVESYAVRLANVNYITFRNVSFGHDNWQVPDAGLTSSTGKINIPSAVELQNSGNINFEWSEVHNTSGGGIDVIQCRSNTTDYTQCRDYLGSSATSANVKIQHSALWDIGGPGIWVGTRLGKNDHTTDSDTNIPFNIVTSDSVIAGTGRRTPASPPWSGAVLHDVTVSHNDVYDTYHSGIALCGANCDFGTGHGISKYQVFYNHVRDCSQGVTADDGCVYIGNATGKNLASGSQGAQNLIWHNLIHDVTDPSARPDNPTDGYASPCLYTDNEAGNVSFRYNVCYRTADVGIRMTGIPVYFVGTNGNGQTGIGATGPNDVRNNVFAYMRHGAVQSGTTNAFWASTGDQGAPASAQRTMVRFINNVVYADRDHTNNSSSGDEYYVQNSCADSNTFPFTSVFDFQANQYFNTLHPASYTKFMHVAHATANPITACAADKTGWDFATPNCWQNGGACYTDTTGAASTPVVQSTGEDPGSSFFTNPGFVSPGYPNDNYHLTCPLAISGFDCSQTNDTIDHAGRFGTSLFNPNSVQTFSTAVYDPGKTNNADY